MALAELWEALGELWEGLYKEKLPINRTSGRYVNLRELVLTHVILATVHGEGRLRAGSSLRHFRGIRGIQGIRG